MLIAAAAQAAVLDHVLEDPFDTESKIARPANDPLRPTECPNLALPQEGELTLNLIQTVSAALCYNPDTQASWAGLRSQAAGFGAAHSVYFPTVGASADMSRSASFGDNSKSSSKSSSAGASASMTLFDFGKRDLDIEASASALEAARLSYDASLQAVIASSLQAYYRLLASQHNLEVVEEALRYANESAAAATLRHELGLAASQDKLQAQVAASQAELSKNRALNQWAIDRAALALVLGLKADVPLRVAEVEPQTLDQDIGADAEKLMRQAKAQRVDLAARYKQLEAAKLRLSSLTRNDLPTLSVSTSQGFSDIDVFDRATTRSQSIGLSLSIPIFGGFSQHYNERAAREDIKSQQAQITQAELNVEQDVWRAIKNYGTARNALEVSAALTKNAKTLHDVSLGRYKEGLGTMLDVLNAQAQYVSSRQQQIEAEQGLLLARADLVRAVGLLGLETAVETGGV